MIKNKLADRMLWAQDAVRYVRLDCGVSASNRGIGERVGGLLTLRGLRIASQRAGYPDAQGIDLVEIAANSAIQNGIGNCYEMSAIAFQRLKPRAFRIGPLNWCSVSGHRTGHGIVILGQLQRWCTDVTAKPPGLKSRPDGSWAVMNTNSATWPIDAVICDPWGNKAYPVSEWDLNEPGRYVEICATA